MRGLQDSAYKLLRTLNRFELPGRGWEGWHMHSGKLWTPEGFGFEPVDGKWWSLLVRQARCFRACYAELLDVRRALAAATRGAPLCGDTSALRRAQSAVALFRVSPSEIRTTPDGNHGENKIVPPSEMDKDHG